MIDYFESCIILGVMYRVKMALAIAVMLLFVLVLGATILWGAHQADFYFQRSKLTYKVLETHLELSVATDRYFHKQLNMIAMKRETELSATDAMQNANIKKALEKLRKAITHELHQVGPEEKEAQLEELKRLNKLEMLIDEGIQLTERAHEMKRAGQYEQAYQLVEQVFFNVINNQFWPLIDESVYQERQQAAVASQREQHTIQTLFYTAITVSILAIIVAFFTAIILYRRLTEPLNQLLIGTEKVSDGNLGHRLNIINNDELGHLAKQFNSMAGALEQQHNALQTARSNLEVEVRQRTKELQRANQRLREIDKSRRQFFADVSHELRTPLTIIQGEAEVTLRGKEKQIQEYKTALVRITELTNQMGKLVDDLLYLARSNTIGVRYEADIVELNELMLQCLHDAGSLSQEKEISIELKEPDVSLDIMGDRIRLKQLLHILIDNACRYSHTKGVIELELDHNQNQAIIHVKDHGIGIQEDELNNVFDRFYRSHEARSVTQRGSGLGLSLAKAIVEAHNGTINLTSVHGKGTTVTVSLPLESMS